MSSTVCPKCNKDDSIQKLSAILATGISTGSYSGPSGGYVTVDGKSGNVSGYSHLSGSSITELAKLVSAPNSPNKPVKSMWGRVIAAIIVLVTYLCVIQTFLGIVFGITAYFLGDDFLEKYGNNPILLLGIFVLFGISIAILVMVGKFSTKKLDKSAEGNYIKALEEYSIAKPKWDSAIEKWKRSYYCHRDSLVFDSEGQDSCEPTNLKEYLYRG
ncbi:MAG TPA: hypothetical protein PKE62_03655 [Anaerolineales bacterium]|nr:hypothetical protein [Anaerolineales bacterium]